MMGSGPTQTYLTEEERAYLRELFSEYGATSTEPAVAPRSFRLSRLTADPELLSQLLGAGRLQLKAEDGPYRLLFDISAVPDPDGDHVSLQFGYPLILDARLAERSARVQPEAGEVSIADPSGRLGHPRVVDISTSGVAIEAPGMQTARRGSHFKTLQIDLPGDRHIQLEGRVVRVQGRDHRHGRRLALRFEHTDSETAAELQRYIFRRHRLLREERLYPN